MNHSFLAGNPKSGAVRVIPFFKESKIAQHPFVAGLESVDRAFLERAAKKFTAEFLDAEKVLLPSDLSAVLLIGLGEKKAWTHRKLVKAGRKIAGAAKSFKLAKLAVHCEDWIVAPLGAEKSIECLVSNIEMSAYEFKKYLETPKEGWPAISDVSYSAKPATKAAITRAIAVGKHIGDATSFARDLSNTPGGDMTPSLLAKEAERALEGLPVSVTVLSEREMKKLKMGGILGVSRGSKEEAKLIVMEYKGVGKQKPLVFFGKGITFDSGGLHIKPSSAMDEMHMDMSGGAAVIAAMTAIARLKCKNRVIGIVPAVENMPSGESYRPGDVLRSMSGKTIEVVSPDAEGRVVLADAMTYAEKFEPRLAIDVATLTGACVVALGHNASALLTPHEKIEGKLRAAGEASGDYLWPLPMWEEYEADIKGTVGDVLNASRKREAGTIDGGMFLWQFAKKFSAWAHIDIASTMTTSPDQHLAKGASGTAVRLLIELARTWR